MVVPIVNIIMFYHFMIREQINVILPFVHKINISFCSEISQTTKFVNIVSWLFLLYKQKSSRIHIQTYGLTHFLGRSSPFMSDNHKISSVINSGTNTKKCRYKIGNVESESYPHFT